MRDPTPPYLKNFIKRAAEPMSEAGKEKSHKNDKIKQSMCICIHLH